MNELSTKEIEIILNKLDTAIDRELKQTSFQERADLKQDLKEKMIIKIKNRSEFDNINSNLFGYLLGLIS
ncbi:hypothetical protein [Peribacillus muralis]|uniref:hypothetical protein n=1 Tax=Peribacillus muralis TaxID=264697 RepID=UPI00070E47BC|nr:hypothetical protein [Peribacillus muralis]